ncbi:MAG: hypothetical protein JSU63_07090 [Phycisphaerales bacterium]|nr:MAG: hypothetical protein JSU63_07090 [Phycisphaerales bacterium]
MAENKSSDVLRAPLAGLFTWLVPGLGHIYLGQRNRGLILLVMVTATFWTGVAIGGVRETVDPHERKLWFVAQIFSGGNTLSAYALNRSIARSGAPVPGGHWLSADVGVHYTGVAGLLNLLVILDAISRADPSYAVRRQRHGAVEGEQ